MTPELSALVPESVTMLGPATATPRDPYAALPGARGIVASIHAYDATVMDRAPLLRVISRTGIGYDSVDVAAATQRGIAVCNAPDGPTISTAEHAVTLMLAAAKSVKRSENELRAGGTEFYAFHEGVELHGKVLGLVGLGRIGRHVARIAGGLAMRVVAFDPHLAPGSFPTGVERADTLHRLLGEADVVSVHVPLTNETRGLFDADAFGLMKPSAVFINTARGGLVDHVALERALDAGHLFAAGLDVTDPEPLPPGHPLLGRDDVVVTPHVAAGTAEAKQRIFVAAVAQVVDVLEGKRPPHLVNPEVWPGAAF